MALLIGLVYLIYWCRTRRRNRDSIASTDPLWHKSEPEPAVRESYGNALSVPLPSPPLRRGHASGMDMVQVSDDPFGATPPSFPQPLSTPPTGVEARGPFDSLYSDTPRSTTRLVYPEDPTTASPGWAQRAFPVVPVIRIQSASTDDYAADDPRSSYAESMVPLETPEDNFRNPFVDPVGYTSTEFDSTESFTSLHSGPAPAQSGMVLRDNSEVHTGSSRANVRMTMKSFRADIVPSPVDTIDRFWDIPSPGLSPANRRSPSTPSSSESLLRSVSPGPGPTSRHS